MAKDSDLYFNYTINCYSMCSTSITSNQWEIMNHLRYWLSKLLYKLSVCARPKPKFKEGDIVVFENEYYKVDCCIGDFYPTRLYMIQSLNITYFLNTAFEKELKLAPKSMQSLYK